VGAALRLTSGRACDNEGRFVLRSTPYRSPDPGPPTRAYGEAHNEAYLSTFSDQAPPHPWFSRSDEDSRREECAVEAAPQGSQAHGAHCSDQASLGAHLDQGFPKGIRLRRRTDFRLVQRRGSRISGKYLVLVYLPSAGDNSRFGLTVSRKVGNAVNRNRVKRSLREAIRRQRAGVAGVDVVFIARTSAASAEFPVLFAEVGSLLERLRNRC